MFFNMASASSLRFAQVQRNRPLLGSNSHNGFTSSGSASKYRHFPLSSIFLYFGMYSSVSVGGEPAPGVNSIALIQSISSSVSRWLRMHTYCVFTGDLTIYDQLAKKTVQWYANTL